MKAKVGLFYLALFGGLFAFLAYFNAYLYAGQEEVQAFVPSRAYLTEWLHEPGGLLAVMGQWITQYYVLPIFPFLVNGLLLTGVGFLTYRLLQKVANRGYHLFLSLLPVFVLLKWQLRLDYVADGTIGLFLLLFTLTIGQNIKHFRWHLLFGVISSLFIYVIMGQWALLYGLLWASLSLCSEDKLSKGADLLPLLLGGGLAYWVSSQALAVPLTDGIYSLRYQESQLQPDSLLHYVTIRFTFGFVLLFALSLLLRRLSTRKRAGRLISGGLSLLLAMGAVTHAWPTENDRQARWVDQLSYLARHEQWPQIVEAFEGKQIIGTMSMNYLNLALAHQGKLGDCLFNYQQQGPQSLLAGWNRTYTMSVLLSDIHTAIGDRSLAESYAMEALTLARRGGSPRMLRRLAEINIEHGDQPLAAKYLNRLRLMPMYREWAEATSSRLQSIQKPIPMAAGADSLLSAYSMERLWQLHEQETPFNQLAWTYQGCSLLLGKQMDAFQDFLVRTADAASVAGLSLPRAFQEAAALLASEGKALPESCSISQPVAERFVQFRQAVQTLRHDSNGAAKLYQHFGDTFWFYFYRRNEK